MIGEDAPFTVIFPGDDVTVYPVIADPPVAGAVNATEIAPAVEVLEATIFVGESGFVVITLDV